MVPRIIFKQTLLNLIVLRKGKLNWLTTIKTITTSAINNPFSIVKQLVPKLKVFTVRVHTSHVVRIKCPNLYYLSTESLPLDSNPIRPTGKLVMLAIRPRYTICENYNHNVVRIQLLRFP